MHQLLNVTLILPFQFELQNAHCQESAHLFPILNCFLYMQIKLCLDVSLWYSESSLWFGESR